MIETKARVAIGGAVLHLWLVRFLSVLLVLGGAGGLVMYILAASEWFGQNWVDIFRAVVLIVLYLFTTLVGVSLWRRKDFGEICSVILLSSQVPIFYSKYFTYEWFTGVSIKIIGSSGRLSISAELGGSDNFHLSPEFNGMDFGINLFAFCAAIYLLISYKRVQKSEPKMGDWK